MAASGRYGKLRFLYAGWAVLETMLFGGLVNGWGALVFVLKEEGIYGDLCPDTNNGTISSETTEESICTEQDAMLNLWFTIAAALRNMFGIVVGLHVFKFGTKSARLTGWVVFGVGALMMAFTDNSHPWLILPSLLTLSYGGVTLLLTNVQVSGLFPRAAGVVVTLVSGAFDFSATTQLLVKILHETGVSRLYSYIGIAALHAVLVLISTLVFLPKAIPAVTDDDSSVDAERPDPEHNNRRRLSLYDWREKRSSRASVHRQLSRESSSQKVDALHIKAKHENGGVHKTDTGESTLAWLSHNVHNFTVAEEADEADADQQTEEVVLQNGGTHLHCRHGRRPPCHSCNKSYGRHNHFTVTSTESSMDNSASKPHHYTKKDWKHLHGQPAHGGTPTVLRSDAVDRDGERKYISIIDVKPALQMEKGKVSEHSSHNGVLETEATAEADNLQMNGHAHADEEKDATDGNESRAESDDRSSQDAMFPTLKSCLTSKLFVLHVMWKSLNVLRLVAFFGLLNSRLNLMFHGEKEQVSHFTDVQAYCMLCIILICWISGAVYDWQAAIFKNRASEFQRRVLPGALPLAMTSALGVAISVLNMIDDPRALYFMFVFFVFYNAFMFGLCLSYLLRVFPERYFGILNGVLSIVQGAFCFLQYGIFRWHDAYPDGPLHANIFMLVLVSISFVHPAYLAAKGLC